MDIAPGEFVALLGHSGCGKSTLLRILAGLDLEIEGEVTVPRRRVVAFQAPRLMPWKRVWRNVVLGLPSRGAPFRRGTPFRRGGPESPAGRPDRRLAERYLAEVGLSARAEDWPKTLSGGEAQRVSLAVWSHRLLAEHLADDGISASQIGRILADLDLKPRRVRGWLTRRADPGFFTKAAEVCDLYLRPPAGSMVVCADERTAIAARSRTNGKVCQPCAEDGWLAYVGRSAISMSAAGPGRTGTSPGGGARLQISQVVRERVAGPLFRWVVTRIPSTVTCLPRPRTGLFCSMRWQRPHPRSHVHRGRWPAVQGLRW